VADQGTVIPSGVPRAGGPALARRIAGTVGRSYGSVLALILLVLVGMALSSSFLTTTNMQQLTVQNASLGIVALGISVLIAAGEFDLSVGSVYALASVIFADVSVNHPVWLGLLAALGMGIGAGVVNGILVTWLRLNSFIATLGTGLTLSGVAFYVSQGQSIFVADPGFKDLGTGTLGSVPWVIILIVGLAIVIEFLIRGTIFGIHLRAVGGNRPAAFLSGVRVRLTITAAFTIAGLCAALAAVAFTSQVGVGEADIGTYLPLDAIAVVVIGGISLRGGEGSALRTLVGFFILAVLQNIFNIEAISSYVSSIVSGLVIIAAVTIDALGSRRTRTE
jgi:ribose transport system permease protein